VISLTIEPGDQVRMDIATERHPGTRSFHGGPCAFIISRDFAIGMLVGAGTDHEFRPTIAAGIGGALWQLARSPRREGRPLSSTLKSSTMRKTRPSRSRCIFKHIG